MSSENTRALHSIGHTLNGAVGEAWDELNRADARLSSASSALELACLICWPIGLSVEFYLGRNQKLPSKGIVRFHRPGYVGVELDWKPGRKNGTIKRIHYTNMATFPSELYALKGARK